MRLVNIFNVFRFLSLSWLLLFSVETMAYLSPVSVTVTSDLYGKIALSWTGLAPGGGWTIYRSTTSGVLGTAIKTGVTNTSYNNVYYEDKSAATPYIYYYYTVKDGASNSSYQYSGKSVYAGPSGLIATSSAPERIDLLWIRLPDGLVCLYDPIRLRPASTPVASSNRLSPALSMTPWTARALCRISSACAGSAFARFIASSSIVFCADLSATPSAAAAPR